MKSQIYILALVVTIVSLPMASAKLPESAGDLSLASAEVTPDAATDSELETRHQKGMRLYHQGQLPEAIATLTMALEEARTHQNPADEAAILVDLAKVYNVQGKKNTALDLAQQAHEIYRGRDNPLGEAQALRMIGLAQTESDPDTAFTTLQAAQPIFQSVGTPLQQGLILAEIGTIHVLRKDPTTGLERLEAAQAQLADISPSTNDILQRDYYLAYIAVWIGIAYLQQQQPDQVLITLEPAFTLSRDRNFGLIEGNANYVAGAAHSQKQNYDVAISHYQQALGSFEAAAATSSVIYGQQQLAGVYRVQGDLETALSYLQQALAATEQLEGSDSKASRRLEILQAYSNVAGQYSSQATASFKAGDWTAGVEHLNQAIQIWEAGLEPLLQLEGPKLQQEFLRGLSLAFGLVGEQHRQAKRYELALAATEQGLTYGRQLLAMSESSSRDPDNSPHRKALDALKLLYSNRGFIYAGQHRYAEALASHQEALAIAEQLNDPVLKFGVLSAIDANYLYLNQYREALAVNQARLAIATALKDSDLQLSALIRLGGTYDDLGRYPDALTHYEQALPLAKQHNRLDKEVSVLNNLGQVHSALGQYHNALAVLDSAHTLTQDLRHRLQAADTPKQLDPDCFLSLDEASDRNRTEFSRELCIEATWLSESKILNNAARVYEEQGRYAEALERYEQSLAIAREQLQESPLYSKQNEAAFLNNIGGLHADRGYYDQALEFYQQALAIQTDVEDRHGIAASLNNIGVIYNDQGQYPEALRNLNQALELVEALDLKTLQGNVLNNIGSSYLGQGDFDQAETFYQSSLELDQALGRQSEVAVSLNNLGLLNSQQGQYTQAIDYAQQALAIHQAIGQRAEEATDLNNLGSYYRAQGQYADALEIHQQALAIAQAIDNRDNEAYALLQLGQTHSRLGQYPQAFELSQKALALFQAMDEPVGKSAALSDQGFIHDQQNRPDLALQAFEQALTIDRAIGNVVAESLTLQEIGFLKEKTGEYEAAAQAFEQALAIQRRIGARGFEGASLQGLGTVYGAQGNPQALELLQQALARHREVGNRLGEAQALNNQGATLIKTAQFSQAEAALRQSIERFESLRTDLLDDQLIAILDTQASAYANLERALIAQDKSAEALAISERGRARAFVLQLMSRLPDADPTELVTHPTTQTPTIAEIQQIARDTNSTLVTYSLIFDQAIYIWVVQPSGNISFRRVEFESRSGNADRAVNPIATFDGALNRGVKESAELTERIANFRTNAIAENNQPPTHQLKALHQVLIAPIADLLPTDPEANVVFIPQGNLFLVPFAALQDENSTYLIENHTILTAPSIQVFGLASAMKEESKEERDWRHNNALLVGDPVMPSVWLPEKDQAIQLSPLPGAKAEAEAIGDFLGIPVLTGEQATEARIKQRLPSARLIHLATHGLLEYGNPQSSGVLDLPGAMAFAPGNGEDGLLTATEILAMDLQADLAILSACDTGRGRITGDGVVGLSRSLITAGVPSVIVSLWAVPDAPTAKLMTEFYRQLNQGQDNAQALRQAMLTTLERYPHPKGWAGFTLLGAAK